MKKLLGLILGIFILSGCSTSVFHSTINLDLQVSKDRIDYTNYVEKIFNNPEIEIIEIDANVDTVGDTFTGEVTYTLQGETITDTFKYNVVDETPIYLYLNEDRLATDVTLYYPNRESAYQDIITNLYGVDNAVEDNLNISIHKEDIKEESGLQTITITLKSKDKELSQELRIVLA